MKNFYDLAKSFVLNNSVYAVMVSKDKVSFESFYDTKEVANDQSFDKKSYITRAFFRFGDRVYVDLQMYIYEWIMPYEKLEVGKEYIVFFQEDNIQRVICVIDPEDHERINNQYDQIEEHIEGSKVMCEIVKAEPELYETNERLQQEAWEKEMQFLANKKVTNEEWHQLIAKQYRKRNYKQLCKYKTSKKKSNYTRK